ncbi:SpdD-like protein [Streptomyces sp. NPDC055709]
MFRPKIPTMPTPTGIVTPPAVEPTAIATALALVGGGTAVVLVVGTVLVSMLLAVAVTAASVAVCALVVRSLLATEHKRR